MSLRPGQSLGPYEIVDRLGAGGMGEVYRARDPRLDRELAVKVLPLELSGDPSYRSRFQREARAASALSHPNIAHVYDVGEQEGIHYLAMELVEGESLRARVAHGPLPVDEVVDFGLQMAEALEEAHAHGVIHRDIKSANAMVTPRGQVKILDFGLARREREPSGLDSQLSTESRTQAGVVMGTVPYMSPEQALGKEVDARTDLFSLGVVLYELATAKLPFVGDTATETIDRICHSTPAPLSATALEAPAELERIVRKCLEKDRERRYATASDLAVDLRNLKRGPRTEPAAQVEPVASGRGRPLARWLLTAAALVVVAALVVLLRGVFDRPAGAIGSVAVLPFLNETGDAEVDYLGHGVTESLINRLSELPDVRVISRTSSFAFGDRQDDLGEIARQLDVEALVVGRVSEGEGGLVVSAELVKAADRRQLWGERFPLVSDRVSRVEGELARGVAQRLGGSREAADPVERVADQSVDPEAYRLYLRGLLYKQGTDEEMQRAASYFRQAIDREPLYALAWAGLAEVNAYRMFFISEEREVSMETARSAVDRALEIDPDLAEGLGVSGLLRLYGDWDLQGAERDLARAVELNPGSVIAYEEYSNVLMAQQRFDEALEIALEAKRLDPLSVMPTHQLGIAYMSSQRFEDAAREFAEAQQLRPGWVWGYVKRGMALFHAARCDEAVAEEEKAEGVLGGGENEAAWSWIAWVYARCGEEARARDYLRRMEELERERFVDPVYIAVVHAGLEEEALVLDRLEEAYRARSPWLYMLEGFPVFYGVPGLAETSRFEELARKVNPKRERAKKIAA